MLTVFSPLEGDISRKKCHVDLRLTPKLRRFHLHQGDVKFNLIK